MSGAYHFQEQLCKIKPHKHQTDEGEISRINWKLQIKRLFSLVILNESPKPLLALNDQTTTPPGRRAFSSENDLIYKYLRLRQGGYAVLFHTH